MKNKYSIFSLIKNSFSYHENWQRAWRDPQPKTSYDAVIGIRCTNIVSSAINIDVYIVRSATNYYLIKTAPIPTGSSLELIDSGSKVVLASGDKITAVSDTASSLDTAVSYIDTIST